MNYLDTEQTKRKQYVDDVTIQQKIGGDTKQVYLNV